MRDSFRNNLLTSACLTAPFWRRERRWGVSSCKPRRSTTTRTSAAVTSPTPSTPTTMRTQSGVKRSTSSALTPPRGSWNWRRLYPMMNPTSGSTSSPPMTVRHRCGRALKLSFSSSIQVNHQPYFYLNTQTTLTLAADCANFTVNATTNAIMLLLLTQSLALPLENVITST